MATYTGVQFFRGHGVYSNYRRRRENSQFARVVGKLTDRSSLLSVRAVANDCSIYDNYDNCCLGTTLQIRL